MKKRQRLSVPLFHARDILSVLYCGFMRIHSNDFNDMESDTFILSKGHAASAWYAVLARFGAFDKDRLFAEFNTSGYKMGVHPARGSLPGIKTAGGSLGQGLGLGCGCALAGKIKKSPARVFVLLGDGECNEGSVWDSMMFASRHKLNNLIAIIDRNRLQSYGSDEQVLNMGDMASKARSFGWNAIEVDGHDHRQLFDAFNKAVSSDCLPTAIVANTIKGKGVSEFEDKVLWHYKWPEDGQYEQAVKELS
jgi:transketolase